MKPGGFWDKFYLRWHRLGDLNRAAVAGLIIALVGAGLVVYDSVGALNRYVPYRELMAREYARLDEREATNKIQQEMYENWEQTLPARLRALDLGDPEAWRGAVEYRQELLYITGNDWKTGEKYGIAILEQRLLDHFLTIDLPPEEPPGLNGFGLLERVATWSGLLLAIPALLMGAVVVRESGGRRTSLLKSWWAIIQRLVVVLLALWGIVLIYCTLFWRLGNVAYPVITGFVYTPQWGTISEFWQIIPRYQYLAWRGMSWVFVAFVVSVATQAAVLLAGQRIVGGAGTGLLLGGWYWGARLWWEPTLYAVSLLTYADPGLHGPPGIRTIPLSPWNVIVPLGWLLISGAVTAYLWNRGVPKPRGLDAFSSNQFRRVMYSIRWRFILYFVLSAFLAFLGTFALLGLASALARIGIFGNLPVLLIEGVGLIPLLLLTLTLLFIVIFFALTRRVTIYLEDISRTVQQVARGDYSARVPFKSRDELGEVADNINRMARRINLAVQEERLLERQKNELITSVSHDLRTPLTSVLGYLDLIAQGEYQDQEELTRYAGVAFKKAKRLQKLIDDLFEFTRLSGGLQPKFAAIQLGELLEQLLAETEPQLKDAEMEGQITIHQEVNVAADGNLLFRLFENLFSNALRYGREGKRLEITVGRQGEKALAEVTNYGPPIAPEDLPYIFERFYRAEKARTGEGAGLGLAIARQIALLHGGELSVESSPGKTSFILTLPLGQGGE